jgi:hypothetical protein
MIVYIYIKPVEPGMQDNDTWLRMVTLGRRKRWRKALHVCLGDGVHSLQATFEIEEFSKHFLGTISTRGRAQTTESFDGFSLESILDI